MDLRVLIAFCISYPTAMWGICDGSTTSCSPSLTDLQFYEQPVEEFADPIDLESLFRLQLEEILDAVIEPNTRYEIENVQISPSLTQEPLQSFEVPFLNKLKAWSPKRKLQTLSRKRSYMVQAITLDQTKRHGLIHLHLRLEYQTLAAAEPLPRGRIISAKDIKSAWLDYAIKENLSANYIIGKQLKTRLKHSEPFSSTKLQVPILVRRGQRIQLRYKKKGITITSKVKAVEKGGKGDLIKVLYPYGKKKLVAKIIDEHTVEANDVEI